MTAREILAWIEKRGTKKNVEGMARYGITSKLKVCGVSVGTLKSLSKQLGRDHKLALELWSTPCYEARMLAAFVDEPEKVTRAQMNAWAAEFDNWAICDHACFHLFDRTPFAFAMARKWSTSRHEFVKRAAFALMASVALHDKNAPDGPFKAMLPLIEKGAFDERNFVKKGVSWALRGVGRRNLALNKAALPVAKRLAASDNAAARWVGKDALRELSSPKVRAALARKAR